MSFVDLQNQVRKASFQNPTMTLALLGDVSTQFLKVALEGVGLKHQLTLAVFESPYDVIQQEIFDSRSFLYKKKPDTILLYFSTEKLQTRFAQTSDSKRMEFAQDCLGQLLTLVDTLTAFLPQTQVLLYDFIEKDDGVFGCYALKSEKSFLYQVRKLNYLLSQEASKRANLYLISLASLALEKGLDQFFSYSLYDASRLTIRTDYLEAVAEKTVSLLLALKGKQLHKALVLDLDNTLWGGILSEDGPEGIQIGENGQGRAFTRFQLFLKQLKERGLLLCVCSKNDAEKAKEPFRSNPEMVLRLDDFVLFVANWQDKATNIRFIQSSLGLGMDSLVFLDDSPFERQLVRTLIPEITVPELPKDPSLYVPYLCSLNLFEIPSLSEEDSLRVKQYQEEGKRIEAKTSFATLEDYLKSLEMVGTYSAFKSEDYARISQLSLRSNQFNLRTIRYTEEEIASLSKDKDYVTLQFRLADRFGDSGLVSLVILHKEKEALFIDTWLMSCRVLKRTMEAFVANTLFATAKKLGADKVTGEYLPTAKNAMVKDLLDSIGMTKLSNSRYEKNVQDYVPLTTFIQGENHD